MPHLRILFDMNQAGDPMPARASFRALIGAIDRQALAGCSLYHGYADQAGQYCIVIQPADASTLGALARCAMSAKWALALPPVVVVDQAPLKTDRLALAGRVSPQGYLDDVRLDALSDIWRDAQPGYQNYQSPVRPREDAPTTLTEPSYPREAPQPLQSPPPPPPAPASAWGGYGYAHPPAPASTVPLPQGMYEPPMPPRAPAAAAQAASLQQHPKFPRAVPAALQRSVAAERAMAAMGGAAAGVLISFGLFALSPRNTLLFQMFDLRKPATVIPVSILAMFFWGIGICLLRWRRLLAMESISERELLQDAIPLLDNLGLHGLHADLGEAVVQVSPLLRRMRAAVHQWSLHPSLQDTDVVLQQQAASDDEAIHTGYSLARTFVWALPVLGLVGTVIGIAGAVGGFANFLGGSIDDIAVVKQNLVNVTGGLSFAFLITLEGLLTSLLLMLASSSLQTRERELYARVQDDVADQLVPALQRVAPEAYKTQTKQTADLSGLRETLAEQAAAGVAQIAAVGEKLLSAIDVKHKEWMAQLGGVGAGIVKATTDADASMWKAAQERMATLVGQISAGMDRAMSEINAGSSRTQEGFIERLRTVFQEFSAQQASIAAAAGRRQEDAERLSAGNMAQQQALAQKLSEQIETAKTVAASLAGLGETVHRILQCQQDLRQALSELDAAPAKAAFDGFSQALTVSSAEMAKVTQSAESLGRLTNQIVSAQAMLQRATQQLADSQFAATLSDFRKAVVSLAPVLASFQKPFVLQAVPFGKDGSA